MEEKRPKDVEGTPEMNVGPEGRTPEETSMFEPTEAEAMQGKPSEEKEEKRVHVEEREIRGGQLLDTVENLLRESSVRRIRVKNKAGRVVLDIPVWLGAIGGVTALIAAPIISAVGVLGGALAGVKLEIEREVEQKEE